MIKPLEMSLGLQMEVANQVISSTDRAWEVLLARRTLSVRKRPISE